MAIVVAGAASTGLLTRSALGGRFAYSPGSGIVFVLGQQQQKNPFNCFFEIAESGEHLAFYYATTPEGFDPKLKQRYIQEDPATFAQHTLRKWWRLVVRFSSKGTHDVWVPFFFVGLWLLLRKGRGSGGWLLPAYFFITMTGLSAYFVQKRFWVPMAAITAVATVLAVLRASDALKKWQWKRSEWSRRLGALLPLLVLLAAVPKCLDLLQWEGGWHAQKHREIAQQLVTECELTGNDHVIALEAHWLYYAGVQTSELPAADFAAVESYAKRRGISGIVLSVAEAMKRGWHADLESRKAKRIEVDDQSYLFLSWR